MFSLLPHILLLPPAAIPGAQEFIKIVVVAVLVLVCVIVLNYPGFHWPVTWTLWGTRIAGAALLIFILYEILFVITGIL